MDVALGGNKMTNNEEKEPSWQKCWILYLSFSIVFCIFLVLMFYQLQGDASNVPTGTRDALRHFNNINWSIF